jgi:hypothetical protein
MLMAVSEDLVWILKFYLPWMEIPLADELLCFCKHLLIAFLRAEWASLQPGFPAA